MTDLMVPSKRPRAPSFSEKHPHEYSSAGVSDWLPEKEIGYQVQVRNFLELCRFCKKKLSQDEDIFMYGYLGAFCSKACREKQMAFDILKELQSRGRGKSDPKKGRICLSNKPKDEPSSLETITTSSPSKTRFFI